MLQVAKEKWEPIIVLANEQEKMPKELQQQAEGLVQIFNSASNQVYFASGTYHKQTSEDSNLRSLSPDSQEIFISEANEVLDVLAGLSFAKVTHNLLKMLESFVPVAPVDIFLRIGHTVLSGQNGGYQYESMANDLIVKLVERYFAEYQGIFQDNQDCRETLLELLDVFVKAGWPSARRLTYKMNEIFR